MDILNASIIKKTSNYFMTQTENRAGKNHFQRLSFKRGVCRFWQIVVTLSKVTYDIRL